MASTHGPRSCLVHPVRTEGTVSQAQWSRQAWPTPQVSTARPLPLALLTAAALAGDMAHHSPHLSSATSLLLCSQSCFPSRVGFCSLIVACFRQNLLLEGAEHKELKQKLEGLIGPRNWTVQGVELASQGQLETEELPPSSLLCGLLPSGSTFFPDRPSPHWGEMATSDTRLRRSL